LDPLGSFRALSRQEHARSGEQCARLAPPQLVLAQTDDGLVGRAMRRRDVAESQLRLGQVCQHRQCDPRSPRFPVHDGESLAHRFGAPSPATVEQVRRRQLYE
jgi:hypothetical protein